MKMKALPAVVNGPQTVPGPHVTPDDIASFRQTVLAHYRAHGRDDLPWRNTHDPYRVLVSEVMLQQTQVARVVEKYGPFIVRFPDFTRLSAAPLAEVLAHWKGLGYNRRALYLKETARIVVDRHSGRLPDRPEELRKLPGIGPNTAGAVIAFAFNRPVVFIETNIRSVFIHRFFADRTDVRDAEIIVLVEATLDRANVRVWYWALMDYGVAVKQMTQNPGRRSAHYARQSAFAGSDRQIRGAILRLMIDAGQNGAGAGMTEVEIAAALGEQTRRIHKILGDLIEERFIIRRRGRHLIA